MINITVFKGNANPMDFIGATNAVSGNLYLVVVLFIIFSYIAYNAYKVLNSVFKAITYAGFTTFLLSLILSLWKFQGTSIIPEWFLWFIGISTAISAVFMWIRG